MNVGSQFTTEILFCIISTSGSSITHGIGGKRCVKLVLLSIMSLNKHLQTNVLLPHAVKSDETAVRKHPYPSGVTLIGEGLSLLWPYLTDTAQSPHRCWTLLQPDNIRSAITTLTAVRQWYLTHCTHPSTVRIRACALCVCVHVYVKARSQVD